MSTLTATAAPPAKPGLAAQLTRWADRFVALCGRIPYSAIALLARFSIAAVFWASAQTKVDRKSHV